MIWVGDEHLIEIRITMHRTRHEQRRERYRGRGRKLAEEGKKRQVNNKGQQIRALSETRSYKTMPKYMKCQHS